MAADPALDIRGVDVALRDGSTVRMRPTRPEDLDAVRAFLDGLSEESRWLRFFSAGVNLDNAAVAAVRNPRALSLVAVTGADGHVIGHGTYIREGVDRAEVAFAVADAWRARGIATIMLAHLADAAAAEGIDSFTAVVMPGNHRMIAVFRESGYPVQVRSEPDEIEVSFPTSLTPEGRRRFEERERIAAVAAIAHVLRPASVVVVGASRRRGTVGGEVLHNLVAGAFMGPLYAVNPHAQEIEGVTVVPVAARAARTRRDGGDRGTGRRRRRDGACMCGRRRTRAGDPVGGLRGGRRRGGDAPARAHGGLPRGGHASRRAELPRCPEHRSRGLA